MTKARRTTFPLWAKLGLVFGGLTAGAVASWGLRDLRADLEAQSSARRDEMVTLAKVVAAGIDGDIHGTLRKRSDMRRDDWKKMKDWVEIARSNPRVSWVGTSARDDRGYWSYIVDPDGAAVPIGYPLFDGYSERNAAWAGADTWFEGLEDEYGLWDVALSPIRDRSGAVTGVVEVQVEATWRDLATQERIREVLVQMGLAAAASFVVAALFARWIARHLGTLTLAAEAVAAGDLTRRALPNSGDEIGRLGQAFDAMLRGLEERDQIRSTFGRFVNKRVVDKVLAGGSLELGGDQRIVSVLMSDLRGFTGLVHELGPDGMVALLNRYFDRMAEVIEAHDGTLAEIAGDGLVAFFGAPTVGPDDAARAVRCAVAMQIALRSFNADEGLALEMGVGVDTGPVIAGHIGSRRQMKYGVVGDAINLASRLESFTIGNEVLISDSARLAAGDLVRVGPSRSLQVKGRREPLTAWPVTGAGILEVPQSSGSERPKAGTVRWWRIDGKRITDETGPARLLSGSERGLTVEAQGLQPAERLKLRVDVDGEVVEDIFVTVATVEGGRVKLHVNVAPEAFRALFA